MHHKHQNSLRNLKLSVHANSVCSSRIASTVVELQEQTQRIEAKAFEVNNNVSAGFEALKRDLQDVRSSIHAISSRTIALTSSEPECIATATIKAPKENNEEIGILRTFRAVPNPHKSQQLMENEALEMSHSPHRFSFAELHHNKVDHYRAIDIQADYCTLLDSYIEMKQHYDHASKKSEPKVNRPRGDTSRRAVAKTLSYNLPGCSQTFLVDFRKFADIKYSFQFQLTMYHRRPVDSPIFLSCRKFDIGDVQRLFDSGLASPNDHDELDMSLADMVLLEIFHNKHSSDFISRGLKLLGFLLSCTFPRKRVVSSYCMAVILQRVARQTPTDDLNRLRVDALRLIIGKSAENPFEDSDAGIYMSLRLENSPVFELLRKHDMWEIDWNSNKFTGKDTQFIENDRQMVADATGHRLLRAIDNIQTYRAHIPEHGGSCGFGINSLLNLAKVSGRDDVSQCCETRIVILLLHGHDARAEDRCPGNRLGQYPKSPTAFARILGNSELWQSALGRAGWSDYEIQELIDEEAHLGIPELLSGDLTYQTQGECRKDFVEKLSRGRFINYSKAEISQISKEIGWSIGVFIWGMVLETILEANSTYFQKSMPGAWPGDEEIRLVPQDDFELPPLDIFQKEIDWDQHIDVGAEDEFSLFGKRGYGNITSYGQAFDG